MYCKRCGALIPEGSTKCGQCGLEISPAAAMQEEAVKLEAKNQAEPSSSGSFFEKLSVWSRLAIASLICGCFTFYKGIDKMVRYDAGDRAPYKGINAYVGGDAYNFIINGNYATAFFVLTAMFVLAAVGLMIVHYLSIKEEH